jgi:hypothetical protein
MSEEILAQESEEITEEELEASSEDVSSDDIAEAKAKATVKKEEGDEDEVEEEEEDEKEASEEVKLVTPKTKNGMLKSVYEKLNSLKKDELSAKYEQLMKATELVEEDDEEAEDVEKEEKVTRTKAAIKKEDIKIDVKDDVEALVQGEDGLSEEFKQKAATIFEAAVGAKVIEELTNRMEEYQKITQDENNAHNTDFQQELTEKVDGYLNYVVEEWMKENELAIERGIRTELVEDFMSGLKTLFTEHYIDIPEEKVDMVDDLFTKVEDLETQLSEEIDRGVELQKELSTFQKDDVTRKVTQDLADTEAEKVAKLAEGIEYENDEQYSEKLNVLKENYFPKTEAVTSEITEKDESIGEDSEKEVVLSEQMNYYSQAIKKLH